MDDKFPSLKLKFYLFSSSNTKQQQYQRQMSAKDNKYRSPIVLLIYISGLKIGRNNYIWKIKPSKFVERLGKANNFLDRQYDEEGDKNTLPKSIRMELSGSGRHETLPVKSTSPRSRYQQVCAKQALRKRWSGLADVYKHSSDANAPRGPVRSNETG